MVEVCGALGRGREAGEKKKKHMRRDTKKEKKKQGPKIAFCSHGNHQNETERREEATVRERKKGQAIEREKKMEEKKKRERRFKDEQEKQEIFSLMSSVVV